MVCSVDRTKHIGLLLAAVAMLVGCYVCIFLAGGLLATAAGWCGAACCGLIVPKFVAGLLWSRTRVVINDDGIEDTRWRFGPISWSEIVALELRWIGSQKFLAVEVHKVEDYLMRMSTLQRLGAWANGIFGFPPLTITFAGLSPSVDVAWDYITTHYLPPQSDDVKRNEGAR